jgi:hypothetical protein
MEWEEGNIRRLHRLFSDKCRDIARASVDHIPDDSWQIWMGYLEAHGVRTDASINSEYDPEAPRLMVGEDGSSVVRLVNMWGDRYIDVPEEFAVRALALGFLP